MRWRDGAALPLLGDDAARGRGPDALGAARSRWLWARRTRRRTRWSSRSVFCGREDGRLVALGQMVRPPLLIFVQSIERAMQLFHALVYGGLHVDVLHAERTAAQRTAAQREATVSKFRAGQVLPGRRLDADWMLKLKLMARTSAGGARGGAHCAQADRTAPAAAARRRTTLRRPTRARPGTATEAHGAREACERDTREPAQ